MRVRNKSYFDEGLDAGREEGRAEGMRVGLIETLEAVFDVRFGTLPESSLMALRAKSTDELRALAVASVKAQSLAELGL